MKNKYLIGILCVCVLISATGCGSDADANAQTADNIEIEDSVETEVYAGTLAALSEDDQEEDTEGRDEEESIVSEGEEYSNPIDAYFLPRIESASCEAERRQMQDTYRGVWKTEFENIMAWMQDKCVYQEDKDTLQLYEESVESLIETTLTILVTNYEFPPGSDERKSWGNSTRSMLNQKEAEIYRNAGMELIDDSYIFMERDYSLELYE
ncbi:MAG: hypothetical protein HFI11_09630 [Lachnospiraceae bacterium]|nr:hypothetical protein [Lachnospiraceae bacterium]